MQLLKSLNQDRESKGPKTVIVFGCGRGGTSAMAGFLRELGVAFPDVAHPLKHEWSPICYSGDKVDRAKTRAALDAMNALQPIWGWKSPKDVFSFHSWISLVRNPYFVVTLRNPIDIMASAARWDDVGLSVAAVPVGVAMRQLCQFIAFTPFPMTLVSYETLCANPLPCAADLAHWLDLPIGDAQIENATHFVSKEGRGYRSLVSAQTPVPAGASTDDDAIDATNAQLAVYGQMNTELWGMTANLAKDVGAANRIVDGMSGLVSCLLSEVLGSHPDIGGPGSTEQRKENLLNSIAAERLSRSGLPAPTERETQIGTAKDAARRLAESTFHDLWARFSAMSHERLLLQRRMDDLAFQREWLERALQPEADQKGVDTRVV